MNSSCGVFSNTFGVHSFQLTSLGKLTLKSDNQAYPDIAIPLNEIPEDGFILGRVMWVLQWI